MHELGIVIEVVKRVEEVARKNQVGRIDTLVLQIGELSSSIPKYIEACFPAAADGTMLQETRLKIEVLPGNARCKSCQEIFNVLKHEGKCPKCSGEVGELLSGKEFLIKEIIAS